MDTQKGKRKEKEKKDYFHVPIIEQPLPHSTNPIDKRGNKMATCSTKLNKYPSSSASGHLTQSSSMKTLISKYHYEKFNFVNFVLDHIVRIWSHSFVSNHFFHLYDNHLITFFCIQSLLSSIQ